MRQPIPPTILSWLCALLLIFTASFAQAAISEEAAENEVGHWVELTLNGGEEVKLFVQEQSGNFIVVRDADGRTDVVPLKQIEHIRRIDVRSETQDALAQTDQDAHHQQVMEDAIARAELEQQLRQQVRKTGRGLVISGATTLGIGVAVEIWALAAAIHALKAPSGSWDRGMGGVAAAITAGFGAPFVLVGTGLLTAGLVKRGKARKEAKRQLDYSVTPSFYRGGGGAQLQLSF